MCIQTYIEKNVPLTSSTGATGGNELPTTAPIAVLEYISWVLFQTGYSRLAFSSDMYHFRCDYNLNNMCRNVKAEIQSSMVVGVNINMTDVLIMAREIICKSHTKTVN